MTSSQIRGKIRRYFSRCRGEGRPPTPAGLALALGIRTAELTQAPLDDESRRLIDRALQLWSNPGDIVLSPFMGIGSEGYEAIRLNRKFIGVELKTSYYNAAVKNLQVIESKGTENELF